MISISNLKQLARISAPNLYSRYVKHYKAGLPVKVNGVLSDPRNPVTLGEAEFNRLQSHYKNDQWWQPYYFDTYSTGRRAYERALSFLTFEPFREADKDILEIACGDGMTGTALSIYGHHVTLLDYQDWRDSRAHEQNFIQADLGKPIPLSDSSFDFIFSFNAFEHIPDPTLAFNEMLRILRPGGFIWLDFNPLYASPLGLHAFSFNMPYPQFLFDASFIQTKLDEVGLHDLGREMATLQPLNQWKLEEFKKLWDHQNCKVLKYKETVDNSHLEIVERFPHAFRGRSLTLEDLTISGLFILIEKI
jgi:SAM-dependent methyltransferase